MAIFSLVVIRDFVVRIEGQSATSRKERKASRREKGLFDDRQKTRCHSAPYEF